MSYKNQYLSAFCIFSNFNWHHECTIELRADYDTIDAK